MQHVQQPTGQGQNQVINFGTLGHIPSSTQKIAPLVQRIRRDIDPHVYNQRLHILGGVCRIDHPYAEARWISSSIKRTLLACSCALGMGQNFVPTHVLGTPGGTPQSSWRFTTTKTSLCYIMKIYLMEIKMSSAKLQKSFRANVCCPTPKHVTTQLFRIFHYQEFYYTGRQI